ncbi:polar amino acid transport system substrate-binding protein [Herbaspirillum sp. Sphag1AN]|uniref:ABC transporter substrate-binding protein n=1 Tax=unclassified Herbaspirillum TaxID=2624150 RepID=UPI00161C4603|nr:MULTISPECIES: ABC transporter substrate-binding protein [unclassified Herbaspirillum]MBB3213214.1 polar amino acid transport system substrate-binding protein [Herbaspirillum sp. Sphag1AN]MBB3246411.1 polar amino acid transport system substrate-binding protein [Herbaspirillum sp. Sphag64]
MRFRTSFSPLFLALALCSAAAHADKLDDIKKAGVLRVAAFDGNPPFGYVDATTKKIVGLDVDYANALGKKLGVKVELVPTNPANRIPLLTSNKVDLVFANFTITEDRAKVIDFSIPYIASGQQFLAKKGVLSSADDIKKVRVGTDKGTTMEATLREKYPDTKVILYDDTPLGLAALRNGNIQALSQDGTKLTAILATLPDKDKYEIPPFAISEEYEGVGVPKGETRLVSYLNDWLRELEKNGTAQQIYDKWFGPQSNQPLPRLFKIGDTKLSQK